MHILFRGERIELCVRVWKWCLSVCDRNMLPRMFTRGKKKRDLTLKFNGECFHVKRQLNPNLNGWTCTMKERHLTKNILHVQKRKQLNQKYFACGEKQKETGNGFIWKKTPSKPSFFYMWTIKNMKFHIYEKRWTKCFTCEKNN